MKGNIQEYSTSDGEERYKVYIDLPSASDERRRKTRSFATHEEAVEWQARMNLLMMNGEELSEKSSKPVGEFLDSWYAGHRNGLRKTTQGKYEYAMDTLKEELGGIPLEDLKPFHLLDFYQEMEEEVSSSTVRIYAKVLRMALDQAVDMGLLENNPSRAIKLPQRDTGEMQYLTKGQSLKFLDTIKGEWPWEGLFTLAVSTGMRRGEILGLKWRDIDLEKQSLSIRRQLTRTWENEFVIDKPKTKQSRRKVELTDNMVEVFERHRDRQEEIKEESDQWERAELVFTTGNGTVIQPRNVRRKLNKVLEEADCPDIRFHDLRHTCATLLLGQGVNPKVVAEQLGHTKISTTLDLYGHVCPTMQEQATSAMTDILSDQDD
jgi:integrase